MRNPYHVWVDSCWLPTISYTMGKRAFHEWLEVMPSNRIQPETPWENVVAFAEEARASR